MSSLSFNPAERGVVAPLEATKETASFNEEHAKLALALKGDGEAQRWLYQAHAGAMLVLCQNFCRNPFDAEEALQDIFLQFFQNLHRFEGRSSLRTWITRIALNRLSRQKKSTNVSLEESTEPGTPPLQELSLLLLEVTRTLPPTLRQVFLLHDQLGFKHQEIAQLLRCQVSTSRSLLCRAREALRHQLTHLRQKGRHS